MREGYKANWDEYRRISNESCGLLKVKGHREALAFGLYSKVDGLAQEIILLLECESGTGAPILLRAMLESFAELRCLTGEGGEGYVDEVYRRYEKQKHVHLSNYESDNPFYNYNNQEEVDKEKEGLYTGRYDPLLKRFERAGLLDWYSTVYHRLSGLSHPSIEGVTKQHDGKNFRSNPKPSREDYNFYLSVTINIASGSLIEVLGLKGAGEKYIQELEENIADVKDKGRIVSASLNDGGQG